MDDRYLCGWRVRSALALPELAPWRGDDRPVDVEIVRAPLPSPRPQFQQRRMALEVTAQGEAHFEFAGVARVLVTAGRRVIIDILDHTEDATARLFFLGTGLATLAFQRGMLPLHAACVELDGSAVAITGPSGAGKSTLTASLALSGVPILADDLCIVQTSGVDAPIVWPSVARIKLWHDAVDRLGLANAGLERLRTGIDKFSLPAGERFVRRPLPLEAFCVLAAGTRRLDGIEAARSIQKAVYRRWLGNALGARQTIARSCMAILGAASVVTIPTRTELTGYGLREAIGGKP